MAILKFGTQPFLNPSCKRKRSAAAVVAGFTKNFRPVGSHIPLLLSCGHPFCEGCLLKLSRQKDSIQCPQCEKETKLDPEGERGVKNLLPDIYLLGVLTHNKRAALESGQNRVVTGPLWNFGSIYHLAVENERAKESSNEENAEGENKENSENADSAKQVLCEECSGVATCICHNCDDCAFCESCFVQCHKALKRLQKHQPLPLSFPRKVELECSDHSGRVLEFFDKTSHLPVCALCVIAEKCSGHEIVPLGELDAGFQEELQNSIRSAKETLACLKNSEKVIASSLPELSITANQFLQDAREFFNRLHSDLQTREATLLEQAAQNYAQNFGFTSIMLDCLQKQKLVESTIKDCEILRHQPQILRLKVNELLSRLEECKNIACFAKKVERKGDYISFVVDKEKAEVIREIGGLEVTGEKMVQMLKLTDLTEEERNLMKDEAFNSNDLMTPSQESSFELVYVTYVKTPEKFYVQSCSNKERLQHMMHNLNKYCRSSDKPEDLVICPRKDELVCAQFLADNNWYRARIVSPRSQQQPNTVPSWENGLPVEVQYIDYGNTESLPLARLRKMRPQFLEVPELAVPCSLVDIVPPEQQRTWPLNSTKAFYSFVGDKPMLMNIQFQYDGKLYVDLRRPDDDEPTRDDERPVSLRDALVFMEFARFKSPNSMAIEPPKASRKYKEAVLPEIEEHSDVLITHVVSPDEIYVQKFASPIAEVHEELAKLYARNRKDTNIVSFPYRNMVCAAKFSEDKLWYRGLITHVYDDCSIQVQFVDYGNSEKTMLPQIRKLPDTCRTLRKQALRVKLKDVGYLTGQTDWSPASISFLTEAILNKPLVLMTKAIEDGVPLVELCDTSTDDDVYINYLFVQRGFANSTGISSEQKSFLVGFGTSNEPGQEAEGNGTGLLSQALKSTPTYRPPALPIENMFTVMGTFVSKNACIYGHKTDEREKETMILRAVSQKCNDGEITELPGMQSTDDLSVDQACVAQFSEDNLWYRAAVVEVVDSAHAEVEFVDFGNREIVQASDIRLTAVSPEIPRQALKFKLYGIEPSNGNGEYANEAIDTLNSIMVNQNFMVHLEGLQQDPSLLVASIIVSSGQDLAKGLVSAGFAREAANDQEEAEEIHRLAALSLDDDFVQPTLPEIGVHFDVTVTQVEAPNIVFIQRLPPSEDEESYSNDADDTEDLAKEQIDQLHRLSVLMNSDSFFDDNSALDSIKPGMACCGKYSKDDQWYRVKIKSVKTKDDNPGGEIIGAEVLFVDYGTSEVVPVARLKRIPDDLMDLPSQAICCELAGIFPPEDLNRFDEFFRGTQWPISTLKAVYEIVADKRLIACILDNGPPTKVILFDRIGSDENETGEVFDMPVGTILSTRNLATYELERCFASQE